jgi:hypothetical protein
VAGSLGAASLQLVAAGDGLWQPAAHIVGIQANSLEVLRAESVASAVNYLRLIASATGVAAKLATAGSDTNVPLVLTPQGTGTVILDDAAGVVARQLWFSSVATAPMLLRSGTALAAKLNTNTFIGSVFQCGAFASQDNAAVSTFGSVNISTSKTLAFSNGTDFNRGVTGATATGPVVFATDGTTPGAGWFADAGRKRVSTQFDKTSDTALANVPGLSATLVAGRTYGFYAMLDVAAGAVGGSQYSLGGTCTATALVYWVILTDATTNANTIVKRQTALGATGAGQAGTTSGQCWIEGTITVNAAGTLTVQFAQNASSGTASSVLVGSNFFVFDAT